MAIVDDPEQSRRVARAMKAAGPIPLDLRRRIVEAAETVETFDDLPDDIRQFLRDAELGRRQGGSQ